MATGGNECRNVRGGYIYKAALHIWERVALLYHSTGYEMKVFILSLSCALILIT